MAIVKQVVLASNSQFRKNLLASTGLQFVSMPATVNEDLIYDNDGNTLARMRSEAKAKSICSSHEESIVIGADQTLTHKNKLLRKAKNRAEAFTVLSGLSGEPYTLHSGLCLYYQGLGEVGPELVYSKVIDIELRFRTLSQLEIESYLDFNEWQGVLGCSRIEGRGICLQEKSQLIDSSSIVGLPLIPLLEALREFGVNPILSQSGPWQRKQQNHP